MKRFFQILGLCSILVFSFYYTDKIAIMVQEKNPVLQEIKEKEESLYVKATDAIISSNTIIPGLYGSKVNIEKSFFNMKALNTFNESYIVYDDVKPAVSIDNNKDKIIISGHKNKKQISLVLEYNEKLINYLADYNINLLINKNNYRVLSNVELINNEVDEKLFKQVNTLLDKDKINKNICLINISNEELCKAKENYLVKNTHTLTSSNLIEVKNSLENGAIILIKENTNLKDISVLMDQIKFQDLEIVYLSKLISENNN